MEKSINKASKNNRGFSYNVNSKEKLSRVKKPRKMNSLQSSYVNRNEISNRLSSQQINRKTHHRNKNLLI